MDNETLEQAQSRAMLLELQLAAYRIQVDCLTQSLETYKTYYAKAQQHIEEWRILYYQERAKHEQCKTT